MVMDPFPVVLCNANYSPYPLERFVNYVSDSGFEHVALYGITPHIVIDHYTYQKESEAVRALMDSRSIGVDSFIPHSYGYSLFAEQGTEHFLASRDYYCNCIRAAAVLGAELLCIRPHNGILSQDRGILILNALAMMRAILPVAEECDINIALGTNQRITSAALNTLPELSAFLGAMDNTRLGVLLDTHVISTANETIADWISTFGNRVMYVFLSDGRTGGYRPFGEGIYPMGKYFSSVWPRFIGKIACFLPLDDEKPPHPRPEDVDCSNIAAVRSAWETVR